MTFDPSYGQIGSRHARTSPPDQNDSRRMKESQHLEWKETWRDDHRRWVRGFANADNGVLVIGRHDKGAALDRFLLRKQGRHWDGVPTPGFTVADLSRCLHGVLGTGHRSDSQRLPRGGKPGARLPVGQWRVRCTGR